MEKKIILSISKLNGDESAGININIPKFVKYLNKFCNSGYLDCGDKELKNFTNFPNFFRTSDYKEFSIKKLPSPFNKPDMVVFQTLYVPEFIKISKELSEMNIPYTIVPRSSMTKLAQNKKKIKKFIGNTVLFNSFVKNASFIHFLTNNEYLESKNSFKFKKYVTIGNGIEMPNQYYSIRKKEFFDITFIGRLDIYHKGLDLLIDAICLEPLFFRKNKIRINLYCPDFENGVSFLRDKIKDNNLEDIVFLYDAVFGNDKEKVLLNSDIFIQTSRMEGHPTGVIEAISYGIPVIVTPGTNVCEEVNKEKLGFISEGDSKSILESIKIAFFKKGDYKIISNNCIKYANENYNWDIISKKILKDYFK